MLLVAASTLIALTACGDDDETPVDAGPAPADGPAPSPELGPRDAGERDLGATDAGPADAGAGDALPDVASPDLGGDPGRCETPGAREEMPCGRCGTQRRFCTSRRVWETGLCEGEHGVCDAGTAGTLDCGGEALPARCDDTCSWVPMDRRARCPLPSCEAPLEVVVGPDETISVDLDTSFGTPGVLPLGPGCSWSPSIPQAVVALRVAATEIRRVELATRNAGTDPAFDGMIELRRGGCAVTPEAPPPNTCFDNTMTDPREDPPPPPFDPRPGGRFGARPGETVYLIVTGNPFPLSPATRSSGRMRLDVTVGRPVTPPLLRSATVSVAPDAGIVFIAGTDAEADVESVRVTFLDAGGMPVDLDGSGTVDSGDVYAPSFTVPLTTTSFSGTSMAPGSYLLDRVTATGATHASITVLDALGLLAAPLVVPVRRFDYADLGHACGGPRVCTPGLLCTMGRCTTPPGAGEACAAASPVALSGSPPTGSVTGALESGPGIFEGRCGNTAGGPEALYRLVVPEGTWDVLLTTQTPGTPSGTDTVLYARRACENATTELGCVDDAGELRSRLTLLDVAAGDLTVFVERYGGVAAGTSIIYELVATLRAVRASGAACDPTGVADRCSSGACSGGFCP